MVGQALPAACDNGRLLANTFRPVQQYKMAFHERPAAAGPALAFEIYYLHLIMQYFLRLIMQSYLRLIMQSCVLPDLLHVRLSCLDLKLAKLHGVRAKD